MRKVTVYSFGIREGDKYIELPSKRSIADIEILGGIVFARTAPTVTEEELRADGRYLPKYEKEDDQSWSDAPFQAGPIVPANRA
jgi:hypothetical protein